MNDAKPFVKLAGGKGQLLEQLTRLLPRDLEKREFIYVEPFVGGGAMLFHMLSNYPTIKQAIINDLNADLVTCYKTIKERPDALIDMLGRFQEEYKACANEESRKSLYLAKRSRYNSRKGKGVEVAALFMFLNRTCFNGLYRVNAKGELNVPFGKAKNPLICDAATIRADSALLQKVEIRCGDFEACTVNLPARAFFYFDPPYRPLTKTSAFTAYSKNGFDDNEQRRLAKFCHRLHENGYRWLLSNSDPHNIDPNDMFFEDLYAPFDIQRVNANRMINSKATGRGRISELAIRNYKE